MKATRRYTTVLLLLVLFIGSASAVSPDTIFLINSYHEGWEWSDRIIQGVLDGLESEDVHLVIHNMDSKRNPEEAYLLEEGGRVRDRIYEVDPDLIIACDDNATKYVVEPYFRNVPIPVVFCGINWDASVYGYPWPNATGMVEVNLVLELIRQLARYSPADHPRIGYLSSDTFTERKEAEQYGIQLGIALDRELYVGDFEEWKAGFLEMQENVDVLIIGTFVIDEFLHADAEAFVKEKIRVPTGTLNHFLMPYSLIGYMKNPEEFGYWSARTALRILNGTPPSDIPMVTNRISELYLNMTIADRLDVVFGIDLLRHATIMR